MMNKLSSASFEDGQTMAEYAVVLGVITFLIVTAIAALSDAINASFERALEIVQSAL